MTDISFALGGLGGFNAHGVGFLQAALEKQINPQNISCTSGQIYWTWRYLLQKNGQLDPFTQQPVNIAQEIQQQIEHSNRYPPPWDTMNATAMVLKGDPAVFRPAISEYWGNFFAPLKITTNPAPDICRTSDIWQQLATDFFNRLLPAQIFVPVREAAKLQQIGVDIAKETEVGVMFNAFDAKKGQEVLFVNQALLNHLNKAGNDKYGHGKKVNHTLMYCLDPANPEACRQAVQGALWLYLYGFKNEELASSAFDSKILSEESLLLDGAYHRQFIIRELCNCSDYIYSVRPQSLEWKKPMPSNQLQTMNLVTQLWFNASYSGEIAKIALINDLLDKCKLAEGHNYRKIKLITIEYECAISFYEYFVERDSVYLGAYQQSLKKFTEEPPIMSSTGSASAVNDV